QRLHPCFFFQAEDGIRDFHVTGVQTCALPICGHGYPCGSARARGGHAGLTDGGGTVTLTRVADALAALKEATVGDTLLARCRRKIGRASCRERGEIFFVGGALNTNAAQVNVSA